MRWLDRNKVFGGSRGAASAEAGGPLAPRLDEADRCIAAIGDLHGRTDLLAQTMARLDALVAEGLRLTEVYIGDYVDRGPDSRGVIDALIERRKRTDREVICLAGNHEAMMLASTRYDDEFQTWLEYGGQATIRNYGVRIPRAPREMPFAREEFVARLPQAHLDFLTDLQVSHRHERFMFVHAGVRPGVPLDRQVERDMLWIREPFLSSNAELGAIVVHGHTPTARPVLRPNRIGVDTGAYQTGVLTTALISAQGVRFMATDSRPAGLAARVMR